VFASPLTKEMIKGVGQVMIWLLMAMPVVLALGIFRRVDIDVRDVQAIAERLQKLAVFLVEVMKVLAARAYMLLRYCWHGKSHGRQAAGV
jgi:hypothetical protein